MGNDATRAKLSQHSFLRASLMGIGTAVLAAYGGETPAATDPTTSFAFAAATSAPIATTAPLLERAAGKPPAAHHTAYLFRIAVEDFFQAKGVQLDIYTLNPEVFHDFLAKMQAAVQVGNPPTSGYHTLSILHIMALDILEDVSNMVVESTKKHDDVVPVSAPKNAMRNDKRYAIPYTSQIQEWRRTRV